MKPQQALKQKEIDRKWHQIDASKVSIGRVATQIANILRGKIKRDFTPNKDMGDFVVAINVQNLKFSGRKIAQKKYYKHSGYLGGISSITLGQLFAKSPEKVLYKSVYSMLDDVKFRKAMMGRLKIIKNDSHNYKVDKIW